MRHSAILFALTILTSTLIGSTLAQAQPLLDHLQCYKVKGPLDEVAVVDMTTDSSFDQWARCEVRVRATELCLPVEDSLLSYTGTELAVEGQDLTGGGYICYKARCGRRSLPGVSATDRFGGRLLAPSKTTRVCTPARLRKSTVFVTSQTFKGNMGGAAGADALCQQAADDAGLGGTFVAWISDDSRDAPDVLPQHSAWFRTDGALVAINRNVLTNPSRDLAAPINVDEYGVKIVGWGIVWTGTSDDGKGTSRNCDNWTAVGYTRGGSGEANSTTGSWTSGTGVSSGCGGPSSLYCFEK